MRTPSTDYRALHGATASLGEAVAALPGYAAADEAFRRCQQQLAEHLQALPNPGQATAAADVLALVDAGKPLPVDLRSSVWQAVSSRDATVVLEQVFERVLQEMSSRRDRVIEQGRDELVAYLDRAVRACVDDARTLDLKGATTAEDAIDAGAGEAWGRMRTLRTTYRAVRDGQATLYRTAFSSSDGLDVRGFGFIENYDQLVPNWLELRRGRGTVMAESGPVETVGAGRLPWIPVVGLLDEPVVDDDDRRFDWLVATPEAAPWVPTPRQMRKVADAAGEAGRAGLPKPDVRAEATFRRALDAERSAHAYDQERQAHYETSVSGGAW